MINFYKSAQWSIIAGTALLIIAFFIIITSNNNIDAQKEDYSIEKSSCIPEFSTYNTLNTNTISDIYEEKASDINKKASTEKKKISPKKLINFNADFPFLIRINKAENFAVVYGIDKDGRHSIPYKAFICSTGREDDFTPLGVFEMSDKYRWRLMVDDTYAQYAIRINGQIMLHSVPYIEPSSDTLESWEYNKLGKPASLGCIRFRVSAIKWIYKYCKAGTKVNIYSKPGEIPPLAIQKIKKIKKSDSKSGWDPTDPAKGNPWKSYMKHQSEKNKKTDDTTNTKEKVQSEIINAAEAK